MTIEPLHYERVAITALHCISVTAHTLDRIEIGSHQTDALQIALRNEHERNESGLDKERREDNGAPPESVSRGRKQREHSAERGEGKRAERIEIRDRN
jgi:hypothetical protein